MKLGNSNTSSYVRPKLGALRTSYSSLRAPKSVVSGYGINSYDKDAKSKKSKNRKQGSSGNTKMDYLKKRTPNYTDIAYREAVGRLRYLLNESYGGGSKFSGSIRTAEDSGEETDDRSTIFGPERYLPSRNFSSRLSSLRKYPSPYLKQNVNVLRPTLNNQINNNGKVDVASLDSKYVPDGNRPPPELMTFIERQEEYIEQLERESQYCRDELSGLLSKVKDVISENESLHEKQKTGFIRSIFDNIRDSETEEDSNESDNKNEVQNSHGTSKKIHLEGPSIVFESRISELEAQLTQAKIDLKNAQDQNSGLKKKECTECFHSDPACKEGYRKQIENLQRDKQTLETNISKLQASLSQLRDTETDSVLKSKRSQGLLEQMIFEKNQSDAEIRRLKEELEKQYDRVREANHETARRVAEERAAADKRYCAQVDQLGGDLSNQWETANKLQLELERQRRIESDYKREITSRNHQIDDLKMELRNKTACLQSDLAQCNAEKQSLEEELATFRLSLERADRNSKSEMSRLNSEITSLRQRLDRSDSDLLQARRENLRLSEQLASLQKEITLGSLTSNESPKKDLSLMIHDMENKHMSTVHELESLVQNQSKVMDKLTDECKTLTQKLDEASNRHKQEISNLQNNIEYLNSKILSNAAYSTNNSPATQHISHRPESTESNMSQNLPQQPIPRKASQSPQSNVPLQDRDATNATREQTADDLRTKNDDLRKTTSTPIAATSPEKHTNEPAPQLYTSQEQSANGLASEQQPQQDGDQYTGENMDYAGYEGYGGYDAGSGYQQYGDDQQYQQEQQYQPEQQYDAYDPNQQQYMQGGEYDQNKQYDNTANQQYNNPMQGQYDNTDQQQLYTSQAAEEPNARGPQPSAQYNQPESAPQQQPLSTQPAPGGQQQ